MTSELAEVVAVTAAEAGHLALALLVEVMLQQHLLVQRYRAHSIQGSTNRLLGQTLAGAANSGCGTPCCNGRTGPCATGHQLWSRLHRGGP